MLTLTQSVDTSLSEVEARQAEASSLAIQRLLGKEDPSFQQATLRVNVEQPDGERTELLLPGVTLALFSQMLGELGNGKHVVVLATDTEVTPQQAAAFLNVSRPCLVKLLDEGKIPFHSVGSRRRIVLGDLLRFKEREEAERHRGLDELVAEGQRLEMD